MVGENVEDQQSAISTKKTNVSPCLNETSMGLMNEGKSRNQHNEKKKKIIEDVTQNFIHFDSMLFKSEEISSDIDMKSETDTEDSPNNQDIDDTLSDSLETALRNHCKDRLAFFLMCCLCATCQSVWLFAVRQCVVCVPLIRVLALYG